MPLYRIISFDGGGVLGVLTATILKRLDEIVPGFLDKADLLAGTSTGGIIALGLAAGLTPDDLKALYHHQSTAIFSKPAVNRLTHAKYQNDGLLKLLRDHIGDKTLGQLQKRVLVSSFDLDNGDRLAEPLPPGSRRTWKAKFFHNFPGNDSDNQELAIDVAMRTSAAPTYFPIYDGFVDGGVIANNPSICAIAQALDEKRGPQQEGRQVALGDIRLLSFGTGENEQYLDPDDVDRGVAEWLPHLVGIMIGGSMDMVHYQCKQILGQNYHRLNPPLKGSYSLDSIDRLNDLISIASDAKLDDAVAWLRSSWMADRAPATQ